MKLLGYQSVAVFNGFFQLRMIVNDNRPAKRREAVATYFNVPSQHFSAKCKQNRKKLQ
jgi:hypothetical protein